MSSDTSKRYALRGVSAKEDVHIKTLIKDYFLKRSVKSFPITYPRRLLFIMHADGAGTKSSLAYMYWKETGDISVWKALPRMH
jgi:phosphoribosylformylglycinamidine cyclo-ligase